MIDTVGMFFHSTRAVCDVLANDRYLASRGIQLYYGHTIFLPHPFGYEPIAVRFDKHRREVRVVTSLPKFLQGHNVFGSNQLEPLCLGLIENLYDFLGIRFTLNERGAILDKRIRLTRADLTVSFVLPSHLMVPEIIEAIKDQLRAQGLKWSAYGQDDFETVYVQQHSARTTYKFYDKYAELQINKIPLCVPGREYIIENARNLLRFELTLRGKELARLGLQYANNWTPKLVRQTLMDRLDRLDLQGELRERIPVRRIEGLNKTCQQFYELYEQGCNLRRIRHYAPLRRSRAEILRCHGVDILRPHGSMNNIALNEMLTEDNAYFVGPKAAVRSGSIWWPKSNQMSKS